MTSEGRNIPSAAAVQDKIEKGSSRSSCVCVCMFVCVCVCVCESFVPVPMKGISLISKNFNLISTHRI